MLELGYVLLGGGFLRERPGQHLLGFDDRFGTVYDPVQGRSHPGNEQVLDVALDTGFSEGARATLKYALEAAGVIFIQKMAEGRGVWMRKPHQQGQRK